MSPGPDPFVMGRVRVRIPEVTKSARRSLNLLLPSPAEEILPASSVRAVRRLRQNKASVAAESSPSVRGRL